MNNIKIYTLHGLADMVDKKVYLTSPGTGFNSELGVKEVIVRATNVVTNKVLVSPVETPSEMYYVTYGFMQLAFTKEE